MPQIIAFTLCSNNYLAHAKTLGDSLRATNPDVHFVIGLVDARHPEIDYAFFAPHEILGYDEIGCAAFPEMITRYNVIEFNTAVKPFYFEYFFQRAGKDALVYYIDPDIAFYHDMSALHTLLSMHAFVLTPHITTAQQAVSPFETMILNVGIYNLGFIGIRHTAQTMDFLKWWQVRLIDYGYIDYAKGLFVDQIWINLVPLLFKEVHITMDPVYNMACWNFHERKLIEQEGVYYVNDTHHKLVFFHFSGFKPRNMTYLAKIKLPAFTLEGRPDLRTIFEGYAASLIANQYDKLSALKPLLSFASSRQYTRRQRIGLSLKSRFNRVIKKMFQV
jgi:hypothetical protein